MNPYCHQGKDIFENLQTVIHKCEFFSIAVALIYQNWGIPEALEK